MKTLCAEFGAERGTAKPVALRLGFGIEPFPPWVMESEIDDGLMGGVESDEASEIRGHKQKDRML